MGQRMVLMVVVAAGLGLVGCADQDGNARDEAARALADRLAQRVADGSTSAPTPRATSGRGARTLAT